MAWLESRGNLARHPKTRRLIQRMGWTLPHTIGNLHLLWYWALEYAPTGDLTKFDPDQLTHDLDLGDATPEHFIDAMIYAGFIDRIGSGPAESRSGGTLIDSGFLDKSEGGTIRLHDWPDYTAKSLRPRFRRDPERWHNVLRSYGRPIITRRSSRRGVGVATSEQPVSSHASRDHQRVEHGPQGAVRVDCAEGAAREGEVSRGERSQMALRAVRRDPSSAMAESESNSALPPWRDADENRATSPDVSSANDAEKPQVAATPTDNFSNGTALAPIPKCLSGRRNFSDWWQKLQEQYKNKGCPLRAHEQTEILAMLARNPFTAVEKLQYSVVNFETSFAKLPSLGGKRPPNTS
jgi:hypothetical protein